MHSDLQLAAELGKTLLERNRELESNIKQQNAVIEDQLQEIEYLSKQTAALREVNDSRLRIYEQLEISIQELEKNNQRLSAESAADKKKIRNLCSTLESLEARCDELQKSLEEARSGAQQQQRGRNKRRSLILDEQNLRRSHSCENTPQNSEERTAEELEARAKVEELQDKMKLLQKEKEAEIRKREELEIQLACMSQENAVLNDQLMILREKEVNLRSFDEELASLDDASSGRLCRKCLGNVDETASNPTIYDLQDSIEDTDVSIESIHGECALVRLKNGGYAWGSQGVELTGLVSFGIDWLLVLVVLLISITEILPLRSLFGYKTISGAAGLARKPPERLPAAARPKRSPWRPRGRRSVQLLKF